MSITGMTVAELAQGLEKQQFSCREMTQAFFDRIEALDHLLFSYILVTREKGLLAADQADLRRRNGNQRGPLDGIPVAVKDIFCTKGIGTTCASKMLYNFVPPYDATCWKMLEQAGAVLLGKTNMDEFAMGSSTESSAFGLSRNPFDLDYVPGGSSGGSAAAVAADLAAYALGTDTGGSVRQPAHYCGVVGIKPTYGRISRYGIIPFASSLDQAGIMAKTVFDAATVLEAVAGQDAYDSTSAPLPVGQYRAACRRGVKGLKIGLPAEFLARGIEEATLREIERAANLLREQGALVEEVSLPHTKYALPAYYVLSSAEASSNLARYDGVRYGMREKADSLNEMYVKTRTDGFGEECQRRIMLGTYALSSGYYDAYYNKTLQVRTLVKRDYDDIFTAGYDCLLTPVTAGTAFKLGERADDPLAMYMTDVCTVPINLAGLPGISIPFALMENGLPIGVQLIGRPFGEEALFAAAKALEQPRLVPPDILQQAKTKGVLSA